MRPQLVPLAVLVLAVYVLLLGAGVALTKAAVLIFGIVAVVLVTVALLEARP